ncbi:DUF445 domain-containing protein [Roseateles terrae]|uniref:Uncharacterized membrane-anchored protein YjiN (DUF445 family) n=1 Tax=Roseateles terrae TaxID=431060 RepID=A0ABR6GWS1_9BURK|nr:DUF445 domain-containing protein [Roseateles terrae]MBB3196548.1 uncharacterized membrane-anchored protein YjiN (DUF445 family) [Roseateles terrae]OWQ84813.1 DUF445 domain-containing protein [Roseateles terrae]
MTDPAQRLRDLRRMQGVALGALGLSLSGLGVSVAMGGQGGWGWFQSFCEAATVGGLADWFAVTALFRHPLGLPIPHTALIPQGKHRIADSLASFVRDNFLHPDVLLAKLERFNPAQRLGEWLASAEHQAQVASSARSMALEALSLLNEESVRRALGEFLLRRAMSWNATATAAGVLDVLTDAGRHQQVLDGALEKLRDYLATPEVRTLVAARLVKFSRAQWPKVTSVVDALSSVDKMADSLSDKLALQLVEEVQEALSQPDHQVRREFDVWIHDFIQRLRDDEKFAQDINALKDRVVQSPDVRAYLDGLWLELRAGIEADIRRDDSALLRHLVQSLHALSQRMAHDEGLTQAINDHLLSMAGHLVTRLRGGVTDHIATTMKAWDDRSLVRQIELSVGRDLQFIRLNGTLVGGAIGLLLHALKAWLQ